MTKISIEERRQIFNKLTDITLATDKIMAQKDVINKLTIEIRGILNKADEQDD